jgi:putative ABC transport system permease protein
MTLLKLSFAYLRARWTSALLNVLLFALGIGTITLLIVFDHQLQQRLSRDAEGIDMVVGAKGSPLQIILASVYHVDAPTGNIPLAEAEKLKKNPLVAATIPLALGDSARGFRIVGTTHDYVEHYRAALASGTLWQAPMEVTLGAEAARAMSLKPGDTLTGSHGLTSGGMEHGDAPYRVVGILEPAHSVIDKLVLTDVRSVWQVHESHHHDDDEAEPASSETAHNPDHDSSEIDGPEARHAEHGHDDDHEGHGEGQDAHDVEEDAHRELTALLIKYRSPLAAALLPRVINSRGNLQAASPAFETARLLNLVGVGTDTLRAFGLALIAAAALGVFIGLYNALRERRYDLAVMRTLGASRSVLLWHIVIEAMVVAVAGAVLGMLVAHLLAEVAGRLIPRAADLGLTGMLWLPQEAAILGFAVLVGVLSALVPAIQAYRLDIARVLARS